MLIRVIRTRLLDLLLIKSKTMKRFSIFFILLYLTHTAFAQENIKLQFRSVGLFDATLSGYNASQVKGFYRIEALRVGFKALYDQFELKADIGFNDGKVGIKDFYVNYRTGNSVITFGNAYEPFSMDMLISTFDLRFHQSASTVLAMTTGRRLGLTYHLQKDLIYFATGVYTDNDINKLGSDLKQAYASTSRLVVRPVMDGKNSLVHIGGGLSVRTPDSNKENTGTYRTITLNSCGVTSMFGKDILQAKVEQSKIQLKSIVELLVYHRRMLFQAEYMRSDIHRYNQMPTYSTQGGYTHIGYLLKGKSYGYNRDFAIPARPADKGAIELMFRYNHTNLNDRDASISGGKQNDFSLGINYYANKYMGVKLNGSYTVVGKDCQSFYTDNFFLMQLRLEYIF